MVQTGIEAMFYYWLKEKENSRYQEGSADLYKIMYEKFDGNDMPIRPKYLMSRCPKCETVYYPPKCENCNTESFVVMVNAKAKAVCINCGENVKLGKCQDGTKLSFYLIGEDPTELFLKRTAAREDFIRYIISDFQEELNPIPEYSRKDKKFVDKTCSFVAGLGNMNPGSALTVIHHLHKKEPSEIIERKMNKTLIGEEYHFRLNKEGEKKNKEFIEKLEKFDIIEPFNDFVYELWAAVEYEKIVSRIDVEDSAVLFIPENKMEDANRFFKRSEKYWKKKYY